jgi:large subunit ribosomal protein L4
MNNKDDLSADEESYTIKLSDDFRQTVSAMLNMESATFSELAEFAELDILKDFEGANLSNVSLSKLNLKGASLRNADLSYADLSGADLSYADLSGADLSYADLSGADLSYANLFSTNFFKAKLENVKFHSVKGLSKSPNHYKKKGKVNNDPDLGKELFSDSTEKIEPLTDHVIYNWEGYPCDVVSLSLKVCNSFVNAQHIINRALLYQRANARQGTASTKTRSEVRGGGRKPWRQKGTGRARIGSNRSPLNRGGGVVFGPKPKRLYQKMNRKERRLALCTAFQSRAKDLVAVEDFFTHFKVPKTKRLVSAFERWDINLKDEHILLVIPDKQEMVYLSARNLKNVTLLRADQLNVYEILRADKLIATTSALEKIQEIYSD